MLITLIALIALILTGCGGSSSSDSGRQDALKKLSAELQASSTFRDPDLAQCVNGQLKTLPTAELQKLAKAGNNPDAASIRQAVSLAVTCVGQGHGAASIRQSLVSQINSSASTSTLPPELASCISAKANAISNADLAEVLSLGTQNPSLGRARGRELGAGYARQCLAEPKLQNLTRQRFLAPIESQLGSSHFSSAFRNCLLRKARQVPISTILSIASSPNPSAQGQTLGRSWAKACVASGAKP